MMRRTSNAPPRAQPARAGVNSAKSVSSSRNSTARSPPKSVARGPTPAAKREQKNLKQKEDATDKKQGGERIETPSDSTDDEEKTPTSTPTSTPTPTPKTPSEEGRKNAVKSLRNNPATKPKTQESDDQSTPKEEQKDNKDVDKDHSELSEEEQSEMKLSDLSEHEESAGPGHRSINDPAKASVTEAKGIFTMPLEGDLCEQEKIPSTRVFQWMSTAHSILRSLNMFRETAKLPQLADD